MNPMDMVKGMMGQGVPPMEMCMNMCRQMSQAVERTSEIAAYATPELRGLFDNWLEQVEEELLAFISETGRTSAVEVADKLKISVESAVFLLSKLAREWKLTVDAYIGKVKGQ